MTYNHAYIPVSRNSFTGYCMILVFRLPDFRQVKHTHNYTIHAEPEMQRLIPIRGGICSRK